MTELKPCPFCGGKVELRFREERNYWNETIGRTYYIKHKGLGSSHCHVRFEVYSGKGRFTGKFTPQTAEDEIIEAWNRRMSE